jgi:hypothetical protein
MLSNDDTFYILKLYQKGKLTDENKEFCRRYFRRFENAVACISDADIFECLSEELRANLGNPQIYYASSGNGVADDFEFRFQNGIVAYIGQILFEEDKDED